MLKSGLTMIQKLQIVCLVTFVCSGCAQSNAPENDTEHVTQSSDSMSSDSLSKESSEASTIKSKQSGISTSEAAELPHKIESKHLPNPVQITEKVISGGLPEGDAAFAELAELGVRTVISVDGQTPDVAMAEKHGLKYVHLPHGYDGIPKERVKELAKAVRDLNGPIYIHCHHGKHRSPAAASVACVAAGLLVKSQAVQVLEVAGTSPKYRGLFQSAQEVVPFETELLDNLQVEFKAQLPIPAMAEAMVHISHTHEHLKQIAAADWKAPKDHPDLSPAHEALLLSEQFTEMLRTEEVQKQPEDFQRMLRESETAAQKLEAALTEWKRKGAPTPPPETFAEFSKVISDNCTNCHKIYRDIPLSEKL